MIVEDKSCSGTNLDGATLSGTEKVKAAISEYLHVGDHPEKVGPVEFVNRLGMIVEHVKSLQGLKSLYKLNNKLENDAANDLKELDFLVKEMKAVMSNVWRLRSKKVDFLKEINYVKNAIEKKSKEELQEMETVIAIYDKDLLKKWHVAKKTSAPASMESFIAHLAGKKQAIEHGYKLAMDRLATLKKVKAPAPPTFHLRFNGLDLTANLNEAGSDTDTDEQFSLC